MAVFVTGDIHGNPVRLSKDSFYEQKDFSGNKDENTVIILGDFGLVWSRDVLTNYLEEVKAATEYKKAFVWSYACK